MSASVADCTATDCPMRTETKPLRSYLDKALFGIVALALTIVIALVSSVTRKIDESATMLATISERVDGTRQRVAKTEDRLDRIEQVVFQPLKGVQP